ncbi:uncharacterized protein [Haliotis asinina]|uniref:uncharacterized protein n=1 Tax=Haliotis asinina TaxID=109174 RepID=UPI0035325269
MVPQISEILDKKLTAFNEKIKKNESDIKVLHEQVTNLTERLNIKDKQVDELYQYGRRNNIRVYGIPEERNETTDQLILNLCTQMGVQLKLEDLDRTHRTGDPAKYSAGKPRPILVKFVSCRSKWAVMSNLSKLKPQPNVFINDDLTKERARLSAEARQLVTRKRLAGTWARDGIVYAKKLDGSIHLIKTRHQFTKLTESLILRMRFKLFQGPRTLTLTIAITDQCRLEWLYE